MRDQQYTFKLKTREEDPFLMNAFQKRNFKLLVDTIEQRISCFEQGGSGQKRQCNKKLTSRKEEPSFNYQTIIWYISVNVFFKTN